MTTITRWHMGLAVLITLALHGGAAAWLTLPTPAPLPAPPVETLRISLLATVAETTTAAPPVPIAPQPVAKPPPKPKPVPKPKPKPKPKPVPEPKPKPIPEPEPEPIPEPVIKETPPEPVQSEPEPILQPSEPTPEITPTPPAEPSTAPLDAVAAAKYEQLLVAWLEKHKKYPRRAKRLRIEGEGMLRILIDRTGQTRQIALEHRTGNRLLDKAALEMAQRANPFPPMPENDPRQELEFMVPVAFALH